MNSVLENSKSRFSNLLAGQWDSKQNLNDIAAKLAAGLDEMDLGPDETVLDIGCGTGNLTQALLNRLSPAGRVVAVDSSPRMIEIARDKITDERVTWHTVDAARLPLAAACCDRVICCAVWPHFDDPAAVATELVRALRAGGWLHVWHVISRERVNEIHAAAGAAVRQDTLPPAAETARVLERAGLRITAVIDTAERYLVSGQKSER